MDEEVKKIKLHNGEEREVKKELTLSDGRTAVVLKGKGKDLLKASKIAGAAATSIELNFALAAIVAVIDGKQLAYEDLGEMELDDVMNIINVFGESKNFPSRQSGI